MVWIKKTRAGSDSLGNVWQHDGEAVDVAPHHAAVLLGITDGGFTEAEDPETVPAKPEQLIDLDALAKFLEERRAAEAAEQVTPEPAPELNPAPGAEPAGDAATGSRARRARTS